MEIITLIYLSGAVTGTVMGDALDPLSINEPKINLCSISKTTDKHYSFEINDYIENVYTIEECNYIRKNNEGK